MSVMPFPRSGSLSPTLQSFETLSCSFESSRITVVEHSCRQPHLTPESRTLVAGPVLGFIHYGVGIIDVGSDPLAADSNHVVVFCPGDRYRVRHFGCIHRSCALTIHPDAESLREVEESTGLTLINGQNKPEARLLIRSSRTQIAIHTLRQALRCSASTDELEALSLDLLACAISGESRRLRSAETRSARLQLVQRAQQLLWSRFDRRLVLDELAGDVGCSRFHLSRLFRETMGIPLVRYFHRLRVNEALGRICDGAEDLSALALDLGYSTHSHFTSAFHRELGLTPSEFRARLQQHRKRRLALG